MHLGNFVLIDYVRASMDILLNMKIEQQQKEQSKGDARYGGIGASGFINSSRGGHGASQDMMGESQRSSNSSSVFHGEPPKVYEEMIQTLEGDVRKHIRIEQ